MQLNYFTLLIITIYYLPNTFLYFRITQSKCTILKFRSSISCYVGTSSSIYQAPSNLCNSISHSNTSISHYCNSKSSSVGTSSPIYHALSHFCNSISHSNSTISHFYNSISCSVGASYTIYHALSRKYYWLKCGN